MKYDSSVQNIIIGYLGSSASFGYMTHYSNKKQVTPIETLNNYSYIQKFKFSPDNRYLVLSQNKYIKIYDVFNNFEEVNINIVSSYYNAFIHFFDDGKKLLVGGGSSDGLRIYDVETWLLLSTIDVAGTLKGVGISEDGLKLFWATSNSPYYYACTLSAGSTLPSTAISISYTNSLGSYVIGVAFDSTDDNVLINFSNATNQVILDFATGTEEATVLFSPSNNTCGGSAVLSTDGSHWLIPTKECVMKISTVDYSQTRISVYSHEVHPYCLEVIPVNDESFFVRSSKNPIIQKVNTVTGEFSDFIYGSDSTAFAVSLPVAKYEVTGTITETLINDTWKCSAYSIADNSLINSVVVTGSTFSIPVYSDDPVIIMINPVPATRWKSGGEYELDDEVYPTDTDTYPFYYKCTVVGISGATEPVWETSSGSTVVDGSVTWTVVERIPQPVAHMPITPTPVV